MFSVIVPVYNGEKTLRRCVESLACQNVEIILVEDGSKDGSWALCQALAQEFPSVTALKNEKNSGVSYTRNRGLEAATKEYILFCDCDDYVEPTYVQAFSGALEKGCDFAICGYVNHDELANGRTDIYGFEKEQTVDVLSILGQLQDQCLLQQLWNKMFQASVIREHSLRFDESISIGEDLRFLLSYLEKARPSRTCLLAQPLYHYMRDQPGSLMYQVGAEGIDEPLKNLRALYALMGMTPQQIEEQIQTQRQKQTELYAYLIMHNLGMSMAEKRKRILKLDPVSGKKRFRRNRILYLKERIVKFLR